MRRLPGHFAQSIIVQSLMEGATLALATHLRGPEHGVMLQTRAMMQEKNDFAGKTCHLRCGRADESTHGRVVQWRVCAR